jgi:1,4-dihydroxy-2-naphthoate octaprenyltransferase
MCRDALYGISVYNAFARQITQCYHVISLTQEYEMKQSLHNWILAFRPKTLAAGFAPVILGTAIAYGDGLVHWPSAFWCFLGALSIQIGTNIANDYFDFKKGADTKERVGPIRVTQAGLITPKTVKNGFIMAFTLTIICSLFLIARAGWPIAVIGILSIISGILYTGGPKPLGYCGLGDIFVLIFFGPVAVAGTYYVQALELNNAVIIAGLGPGFISSAILAVNNMRDRDSDSKTGKRTLAVLFGRRFVQYEFYLCLIGAALVPVFLYWFMDDHLAILLTSLILLPAMPVIHSVFTEKDGARLNQTLASTGKLLVVYAAIFSITWILS